MGRQLTYRSPAPPILASKIHLNFMFFLEPFLDLLFLVFSNMMTKNVILGPSSKSAGIQNDTQNPPSAAKRRLYAPIRAPPGSHRIDQIQYKSTSGWHFAFLTFFCFAVACYFSFFLKENNKNNASNATLQITRETSSRCAP